MKDYFIAADKLGSWLNFTITEVRPTIASMVTCSMHNYQFSGKHRLTLGDLGDGTLSNIHASDTTVRKMAAWRLQLGKFRPGNRAGVHWTVSSTLITMEFLNSGYRKTGLLIVFVHYRLTRVTYFSLVDSQHVMRTGRFNWKQVVTSPNCLRSA